MVALPRINLNRMEIEEAGNSPDRLAAAIHAQLGQASGSVDIEQIAWALDIDEIRAEDLTNLEGALITTQERGYGQILVNKNAQRPRQRFTIAHELGHFLIPWHIQTLDTGFWCSKSDIQAGYRTTTPNLSRHEKQEHEANRFAIELLAPRHRIEALSKDEPGLEQIIAIADRLMLSKQAAAYRYIELHPAKAALFISENGLAGSWSQTKTCPPTGIKRGQPLPVRRADPGHLHQIVSHEAPAADWFDNPPTGSEVWVETFYQKSGNAMTLVSLTDTEEDEEGEGGNADAFDRFGKWR